MKLIRIRAAQRSSGGLRCACPRPGRRRVVGRLLSWLRVALIWTIVAGSIGGVESGDKRAGDRPLEPKDLQIVDCLLPGRLQKLGRQHTSVSQRRPARTSALECEIRGGAYVAYDRADLATALKFWLAAAEGGDAQAQYYVGEIYERGLGTAPDYAKAAEWYRRAAEGGNTQAKVNLGFLYEKGLGVPQDTRAALEWYRLAAGISGGLALDSDLAAVREELAAANERLAAAEKASAALEQELTATRGQLKDARAKASSSASDIAALEKRVQALEQQSQKRRQEVEQMRASGPRQDLAGPRIEIIDARVTRGASAESSGEGPIIGRVDAPAGLDRLSVDGKPLTPDAAGFFEVRPGGARRLTFVAFDRQGKRAEQVWYLDDAERARASTAPSRKDDALRKRGKDYALVIGNGAYAGFPRLATAEGDATAIGELLRARFGFRVTLLRNAGHMDILAAMRKLRDELREEDRLVIYYAGHGEIDPVTDIGYWLPIDAEKDRRTHWLSSREIALQVEQIPCRHVLVIADSCYSGALTRSSLTRFEGGSDKDRQAWIREIAQRRSRTALTSGGLSPVLDAGGGGHSIFAQALLDTLARQTGALETYELWSAVRARVMFGTRALRTQQVPEFAPIQYAGHESGQFVFVPARSSG